MIILHLWGLSGDMTSAEFKEARYALGYSARSLALEWGMGENGGRTIRRWESGDTPLNPVAAYCIKLMLDT